MILRLRGSTIVRYAELTTIMIYLISRTIFELFIRILFKLRICKAGGIPNPPFIVVSNHSSLLDPPLVGIALRKYRINFMAKKELFDMPIIGIWSRLVCCIEARRGENSVRSLKEALRRVKKGCVVGVFPEGTRSVDGTIQEAKRGTGFLISKAAVPVVPVYVNGADKAFPKGKGIKRGTLLSVFVGKPIMPEEFLIKKGSGKVDYEAISGMIMERIVQLRETMESNS